MKILAFVDTHGNKTALNQLVKASEKADILVCAGDITNWGNKTEETLNYFKDINKPLLIIPGNHESTDILQRITKKYNNIIFFHKAIYQLNDYLFIGYGGGGFSEEDRNFEQFIKKIEPELKDKKLILITHAPAYGTKVDNIPSLGHRGCESYTNFIKKYKPMLHISGHLHETANKTDVIGKTLLINPGPTGKLIKI